MSWHSHAACTDEDPDLFFPVGSTGPALVQIEEAKDVCRSSCPVMEQCRAWAFEFGESWGVWGGSSEDERRQAKRRAARERARDAAA
ncbi:WhiB family transcriptional regulator [Streptomyces olivoreticuli]